LASVVVGGLGELAVFGALHRVVYAFFSAVGGPSIFLLCVLGIVGGVLVLSHVRWAERRWVFVELVALQILVSAFVAIVTFDRRYSVFNLSRAQERGGLVGAVIAGTVHPVVGTVGGAIIVGLLALLLVLNLGGVRIESTAQLLATLLRSRGSESTRAAPESGGRTDRARLSGDGRGVPDVASSSNSLDDLLALSDQPHGDGIDDDATAGSGEILELISGSEIDEVLSAHGREDGVEGAESQGGVAAGPSSELERLSQGVHWRLPSSTLLRRGARQRLNRSELIERGATLQASLLTHGVPVKIAGMTVGPTVTRYELELGEGIKVARILALHRDIAYAMAATDVRILAPIPGRSAIGVEVPNRTREVVTLGDVMTSPEMRRAQHPLEVPLGQDISGTAAVMNLAEMPHVLIAGATGAGKSSALNSLLTSILMRSTPDDVRLILIDPKRVELGQYNRLPHLLTAVVVDPKKAANALSWAVKEMELRYDLLASYGVRDIGGYNALVRAQSASAIGEAEESLELTPDLLGGEPSDLVDTGSADGVPVAEPEATLRHLPYILVVVDELNDLMMAAARDVEDSICRIAQKARAVGIHLVIATQRPSVDVITGVIKANVPSRMAFAVASQADSRVILDHPGAEKLVGQGDMLLVTASSSHPRRIQSPWVSEEEVRSVVATWVRQGDPRYVEGVEGSTEGAGVAGGTGAGSGDELFGEAVRLVVLSQLGSTSMLQRKLRVGFARAGRLMDLLEQSGIVGASEGSKAREVLMSVEEYEESHFS
jgi:S-DNA-T family DNA segregation ATPase FtsK/SpoIIIE